MSDFTFSPSAQARIDAVTGFELSQETLDRAFAELALHGRVMLTATQVFEPSTGRPNGAIVVGVVQDYYRKPEEKTDAR